MEFGLIQFFGTWRMRFPSGADADAHKFADLQSKNWSRTINSAIRGEPNQKIISDLSLISDFIDKYKREIFDVHPEGEGIFAAIGIMSLLDKPVKIDLSDSLIRQNFYGIIIYEFGTICAYINEGVSIFRQLFILNSTAYLLFAIKYAETRQTYNAQTRVDIEGIINDTTVILRDYQDKFAKIEASQQDQVDKIAKLLEDIKDQSRDIIKKIETDADEKVEARLKAKSELDRISKAVDLWTQAARRHRRRYYVGLSMLFTVICASFFSVIIGLRWALDALGFLKQGVTEPFTPAATFTLATIVALIAGAGFVLKIAGRLVTNALTLAEDAEVRAALADTFFGLAAEDTKASDDDRGKARTVMLAALFRPLPGHQQEEITTPTVISLAQDMLSGKKS